MNLTPFQRILLFISLSLATFMMVLDYSIANVSIPYISGDLGCSNDQGTYVITSFAVGNAIGLAMTGWMAKRVGQIRLIVIAVILFTIFSWMCGASISLQMLVVSRFIQGLVAGPIVPLSQSLLISTGTPESRTKDLAIWATIVITAPVLGPILGGYISDWHHWSGIFYINIPVGIFCAFTIWTIMKTRESKLERPPMDLMGIILLSIGVMCLQIFLDKGQQWDWWNSNAIRFLVIGTIISFALLIIREVWYKNPFLNLRLFSYSSFSLSIICLAISYAIYFGTIVLVPLWLQEYMGYNAVWAGIAVCTIGIGPALFSMITPRIIKQFGNLTTLMIGFCIFAFASFYTSFLTTAVDVVHIAIARFIFGFAFICYINPLLGMSVEEITAEHLPSATGIFHFIRAMVGGIGTSIFTTIWIRRTIFHHERLGSALTLSNPLTPQGASLQELAILNDSLDQQAAILAINDAFYLMGWLFVALLTVLIAWRLINAPKKAKQPLQN